MKVKVWLFDGEHVFENDDSVARSLIALKSILENDYPDECELSITKTVLLQAFRDHENNKLEFERISNTK